MSIEKEPFRTYTLEEDKDPNTEVMRLRLNKEERAQLNQIRKLLNIEQDSKALKAAAWIGLNVLLGTFGEKLCLYLFKKERLRLEDLKSE